MRKLVKIFSYLFAVMMVLCLLPSKTAWAARGRVELGESKYTTSDSYEMEIGDSIDLNFYGAKGYIYKTDSGSVFWKTTNSNIVSVDRKGLITAVAPGSATVSMTVTVAATRTSYEGSVEVIVKAKDKVQFGLVSYERAVLIYPTEESALSALHKGIRVDRIRKYNYGATSKRQAYANVSLDLENKNIINIDLSFNNGDSYVFYAEGLDANGLERVITWDTEPVYAKLSYENAYISSAGGRDITGKKSLSFCDATPAFDLYDKNDVIIGKAVNGGTFVGAQGVTGNVQYIKKYVTGNATLRSITSGVVRLSSLDQNATIYAIWTSGDKKQEIRSNEFVVQATEYVKPDLGGFVEGIVATTKKGDDIDWNNSESWMASVPASSSRNILFYFLGSDGKKYSGCSDAYYNTTQILPLNTSEYRFVYELDEESQKIASITKSGKLQTYKEGNIIVYIYQCEPGLSKITPGAQVVGQLNLSITEEPELYDIDFNERLLTSAEITNLSNIEISFTLFDQYSEVFSISSTQRSNLRVTADDSSYSGTIPASAITWNSDNAGGKIKINLSGKPSGTYTYHVRYTDIIDDEFDIIIY